MDRAAVGPYIRRMAVMTEPEIGLALSHADRCIAAYVGRCRERIPSFVDRHFSLAQAWSLQRGTIGRDLLCAPVNSACALPHLALQKATEALARVGYLEPARWAKRVPSGVKTGYQTTIEGILRRELLEWHRDGPPDALPEGFLQELEAVPGLRNLIETAGREAPGPKPARKIGDLLQQFSAGRALVSDVSATVLTLGMGWWLFGNASLGLKGLAHGFAQQQAQERAASRFFLGKRLGSHFYQAFPPDVPESSVWTILALLTIALSVGVMACTVLSEPLRKSLGFQRNRLELLLDEIERELVVLTHRAIREAPCSSMPRRDPRSRPSSRASRA
jgi:hypothetical protein